MIHHVFDYHLTDQSSYSLIIANYITENCVGCVVVRLLSSCRWKRNLGFHRMRRIVWLGNLKPHEYLTLLAVGDLMIGKRLIGYLWLSWWQ